MAAASAAVVTGHSEETAGQGNARDAGVCADARAWTKAQVRARCAALCNLAGCRMHVNTSTTAKLQVSARALRVAVSAGTRGRV